MSRNLEIHEKCQPNVPKKAILVVFGGVSPEHEISLCSAVNIIKQLDRTQYDVYRLGIRKQGEMLLYGGPLAAISEGEWERDPTCQPCVISPDPVHHGVLILGQAPEHAWKLLPIDCVVPVLHGKNGEDGTIQGLLDLAQIPYVGCGVLASSACLDKHMTRLVLTQAGITMAKALCVKKDDIPPDVTEQVSATLGFPVFVKPVCGGSSVGVTKVSTPSALLPAMAVAFLQDDKLLIEQNIIGREIETAVLEEAGSSPQDKTVVITSLPGEILPKGEFYDYDAKYQAEGSPVSIPANLSIGATARLQQIAVKAFRTMGCRGLARIDFFVTTTEEIILNEINTFPGFTAISMYPVLWQKMGVSGTQLLDRLIALAIAKQTISSP